MKWNGFWDGEWGEFWGKMCYKEQLEKEYKCSLSQIVLKALTCKMAKMIFKEHVVLCDLYVFLLEAKL